ncbi:MAG: hypothetical protein NC310_03600 [Roseburia sp.]|nr:hypothetical protein [Roseburia sp.]MCM1557142.1 hypothetical protein [Anaeroplasma bactoclasticum]
MKIMDYIEEYVNCIGIRMPIFTQEIYDYVFSKLPNVNKAVINEYIVRYAKQNPEFIRYQKGIYYKTTNTPFGQAGINLTELIKKNYLFDSGKRIGYETGPSYMNKIGLTTQMPKFTFIATENKKSRPMESVYLIKPVTHITEENFRYLQLLDMMENRVKVHFEVDRIKIFRDFIDRYELNYEQLLNFAKLYHNNKIYQEIAETTRGEFL